MIEVKNYVCGQWVAGEGTETTIYNAITGDQIGSVSSAGIDFEAVLNYGRKIGGSTLRKMTFQERGRMLKALALFLMEQKNKYYEVSAWTGATKVDSWIDIEGGIGNLFANASLRRQFPDLPYYVDGTAAPLFHQHNKVNQEIDVGAKHWQTNSQFRLRYRSMNRLSWRRSRHLLRNTCFFVP